MSTWIWVGLWVGSGCAVVVSDNGVYEFEGHDVASPGAPLKLSHSRLCPSNLRLRDTSFLDGKAPPLDGCVVTPTVGDASWDDGCIQFGAGGEAALQVDPVPCDAWDDGQLGSDRFSFRVVGAKEVDAQWVQGLEELAEDQYRPGPEDDWPVDWIFPDGEPLRLVAGAEVWLLVELGFQGEAVGWMPSQAEPQVAVSQGEAPAIEIEDDGWIKIVAGPDTVAEVSLAVDDTPFVLGDIVGIPAADLTELQVVVAYLGTEKAGAPIGARAIGRTADGRPTLGAPVTWSYDGDPLLNDPKGLAQPDITLLSEACPALKKALDRGPYAGTLTASLGDLVASVPLAWSGTCDPDPEPVDAVPDDDPRACGCASSPGPALPWLAALGWGLWAIRRRGRGQRRALIGSTSYVVLHLGSPEVP